MEKTPAHGISALRMGKINLFDYSPILIGIVLMMTVAVVPLKSWARAREDQREKARRERAAKIKEMLDYKPSVRPAVEVGSVKLPKNHFAQSAGGR